MLASSCHTRSLAGRTAQRLAFGSSGSSGGVAAAAAAGRVRRVRLSCRAILQEEAPAKAQQQQQQQSQDAAASTSTSYTPRPRLSTEEWRKRYERDGTVDLFLEDDFNAGQVSGRAVYMGGRYGVGTGEGPSRGDCATHRVKIINHYAGQTVEVDVPEDRYILWEAEDAGLELPWSCRMGCCTACAVKVKEGTVAQPEALGVSEELKRRGYALMCVSYPLTDAVLETVPEDEVYDLQFGRSFAQQALNPDAPSVERDDFALEIAQMDE